MAAAAAVPTRSAAPATRSGRTIVLQHKAGFMAEDIARKGALDGAVGVAGVRRRAAGAPPACRSCRDGCASKLVGFAARMGTLGDQTCHVACMGNNLSLPGAHLVCLPSLVSLLISGHSYRRISALSIPCPLSLSAPPPPTPACAPATSFTAMSEAGDGAAERPDSPSPSSQPAPPPPAPAAPAALREDQITNAVAFLSHPKVRRCCLCPPPPPARPLSALRLALLPASVAHCLLLLAGPGQRCVLQARLPAWQGPDGSRD